MGGWAWSLWRPERGVLNAPLRRLCLQLVIRLEMFSGQVLLGVWSPSLILDLFLNEFLEVDRLVKLICFGAWVADPSLGIQVFCDLPDVRSCAVLTSLVVHTFMTCWLFMRRNILPSFCSSTVVNGKGRHLLVGFFCNLETLAIRAARHLSKSTVTARRSNRWWRRHRKVTFMSSRRCTTLRLQNCSGTKFLTRK